MNEVYRDLIMKHYQNPQNWGLSKDPNFITFNHKNISCGDSIILQIKHNNRCITDIKYETQACALCLASASLMSIAINKLAINQALNKIDYFLSFINNQPIEETKIEKILLVFKNFSHFPGRIACISLPWQALQQIIRKIKNSSLLKASNS